MLENRAKSEIQLFLGVEEQEDILQELLADKRSPNTRRAYRNDLTHFFLTIAQQQPSPQVLAQFLSLDRATALAVVLKYKAILVNQGLKEATVNRRLAAIKALVRYANKRDNCRWVLDELKGEKVQTYRDTSGVDVETFRRILEGVNQSTTKGLRDYAILHLLWSNALRRNEVVQADISDFDPYNRTLLILGKGKGTQKQAIALATATTNAIQNWLAALGNRQENNQPLFTALDNRSYGHRLTGQAIYNIVKTESAKAGVNKVMSPHRCRHSAITAALDATDGNVRKVQKFSRHAKVETLLIYDDNRVNAQGEMSDILTSLLID